jgi:CheY-like chemotaxis protein
MAEGHLKVLLVEDNAGDARLVQEMLNEAKTSSFLLTSTGKLEEALKVLSRDSFDIIILDLQLPNSHGLDTFKEINSSCPDTPIVVLAASSMKSWPWRLSTRARRTTW